MSLNLIFEKLSEKHDLTVEETRTTFDVLFSGTMPEKDMVQLLVALRDKGETVDEILGAAQSMRAHMRTIKAPPSAIDIVGTGGDNHGTFNVSTATAFVVAACGVPVAKHGNRAVSSRSGSSDVLGMLGINLEPDFAVLEKCLAEIGIVFLFAPVHHPAMRHVADVRRKMAVRTIFNLLGPLTNPAQVTRHMIGVYDLELLGPMAEVLKALGSERAWLAHGHDGMDEITTTGATDIVELRDNQIRHFTLTPQQIGFLAVSLEALKGGDASANADAIRRLFQGERGAFRDIVLMNAAAALVVVGKAETLNQGVMKASEAIDSGMAGKKLDALVRVTNGNAK